jgi:hypothetical protein
VGLCQEDFWFSNPGNARVELGLIIGGPNRNVALIAIYIFCGVPPFNTKKEEDFKK